MKKLMAILTFILLMALLGFYVYNDSNNQSSSTNSSDFNIQIN